MTLDKIIKSFVLRSFCVLVVLSIFVPMTTFSAEASSPSSLETDTQIELEPGIIEITEVPSLGFKGNSTGFASNDGGTIEATITGSLVIEDARGSGAGWSLHASLGEFVNVSSDLPEENIGAPILTIEAPDIVLTESFTQSQIKGYTTVLVAGDGNYYKIASAPPGTSGGVWKGTIPSASIALSKEAGHVGIFKTKMSWSIQDTP